MLPFFKYCGLKLGESEFQRCGSVVECLPCMHGEEFSLRHSCFATFISCSAGILTVQATVTGHYNNDRSAEERKEEVTWQCVTDKFTQNRHSGSRCSWTLAQVVVGTEGV